MAEKKRYDTAAVEEKRGASEKPLGHQISKEAQKTSRRFLTNEQKPGRRSILELRGLGKEIWEGADAQEHVESLRKEWDQGMFKEHERVVLTADTCGDEGEQLRSGDVGVVVHIHAGGEAYVVEFVALDGDTAAIATVLPSQIRPVTGADLTFALADPPGNRRGPHPRPHYRHYRLNAATHILRKFA